MTSTKPNLCCFSPIIYPNLPRNAYKENCLPALSHVTPYVFPPNVPSIYETPSIYLLINKGTIHAQHDILKQESPNSRHFSYTNIDFCGALPWKELFWLRKHQRRIRCPDLTETNTSRRHPPNKRTGTEKCFPPLLDIRLTMSQQFLRTLLHLIYAFSYFLEI